MVGKLTFFLKYCAIIRWLSAGGNHEIKDRVNNDVYGLGTLRLKII